MQPSIELSEFLEKYPACYKKIVEWGDMDAMQHVNNVRYFYYAESARLQLLSELFPAFADGSLAQTTEGYTLAETSCRYKVSLTWPDTVHIASVVESISETSFTLTHLLFSQKLNCVAAELQARMVRFDFAAKRRSAITDSERSVLNRYATLR